ncbi:hypothetical protein [Lentzea sp. CA-135723]|uniref:hypothetical protein n=1 Tax=Lentzea sp. CA-135723 TaxID=3239950 RepID=UPI003D8CC36D
MIAAGTVRTQATAEVAYVHSTTVTVAGPQASQIDLLGWGTSSPVVSLQLGPVLCRVAQPHLTVKHVTEIWRGSAVLARRLPAQLPARLVGRPSMAQHVAGVVLHLDALPGQSSRLVPPTVPNGLPLLELRIGPVIWLVLDQAAWASMTDIWEDALGKVAPLA